MRVLVIDTGDPGDVSGGQSVFVRTFATSSRHEVVVAGTVPMGTRLGRVLSREVGDGSISMLGLAHHGSAGHRPLVPERLRTLVGGVMWLGRARDADLIYVQSAELMLAALLRRDRRAVVFHLHGAANPLAVSRYGWARWRLLRGAYAWFSSALLSRVDRALSVDLEGCDSIGRATGGRLACEVLPPAFDERLFSATGRPAVTTGKRLVYVGRLERAKHVELLVEALARLRSAEPEWTLSLVGEGSERAALQARVVELGIADGCEFLGWRRREDLPALLRESDLFVLPSEAEGLTTAVIEAMACGTPVLCRSLAGLSRLVQPGVNGEFWYGEDAESLAAAIEAAAGSPWEHSRIAESVEGFSASRAVARVDDILQAEVDKRPRRRETQEESAQ
jgi:glycosyltransferase involved in cell wall biosynthesis